MDNTANFKINLEVLGLQDANKAQTSLKAVAEACIDLKVLISPLAKITKTLEHIDNLMLKLSGNTQKVPISEKSTSGLKNLINTEDKVSDGLKKISKNASKVGDEEVDPNFREALENNVFMFSGFKTHQELEEVNISYLSALKNYNKSILTKEQEDAIENNYIRIEQHLKIKRGDPMNIADALNANPKKNFENCAACTMAFLLRLRGFNVSAKVFNRHKITGYFAEFKNWSKKWETATGEPVKIHYINEWLKNKKYKQLSVSRFNEYLKDVCVEDGLYEIGFNYTYGASGHYSIILKKGNNFYNVEAQNGRLYPIEKISIRIRNYKVNEKNFNGIVRIDDKIVSRLAMDLVVKN